MRWMAVTILMGFLVACSGTSENAEPDSQTGADNRQDVGTEVLADVGTEVLADVGTEVLADVGTEVLADVGTEVLADVGTEVLADVGTEVLADVGTEVLADVGTEVLSDVGTEVLADVGTEVLADVGPEAILIAYITEPATNDVFKEGEAVTFTGFVQDTVYPHDELTAVFSSSLDGELWSGAPDETGQVAFTTTTLSLGQHNITLVATSPSGEEKEVKLKVGICTEGEPETFDAPLTGNTWKVFGDAFWDPGGWLDMTDNVGDRLGWIFNVSEKVNPGDVVISFSIQTGPNVGTGADGFAMTVFDAEDVVELEALIAAAHGGGGLGYGVSGPYGPAVVEALHVEIDTWYNQYNGTTELHTDPTSENHIAVCLNGNPGDCPLWTEVPSIEDMNWHDVSITIVGYHITVTLDSVVVLEEDIPGFEFRGGYIGFSGSTGYYSNYHRFDNLHVVQACVVP